MTDAAPWSVIGAVEHWFACGSAQRLERMEQTLEAVAIEVERITEGQRVTTKLLSEGRGAGDARPIPSSAASPPDRAT